MEDYLVPLATPCVYYYPNLLSSTEESSAYYETLKQKIPWQKTSKINRWVALYEEKHNNEYKYRDAPSTQTSQPLGENESILQIKLKVEELYKEKTGKNVKFNTCLANFYENGEQRIGWHTDREEIGRSTPIASVSLGATRTFLLRHQINGVSDRASVEMHSGSVIFMENICQTEYLHSVPRQSEVRDGRINLTFRCKTVQTAGEEEHLRRDKWLSDLSSHNVTEAVSPLCLDTTSSSSSSAGRTFFGDSVQTNFSSSSGEVNVLYTCSCNIGTECHLAAEISELLDDDFQKQKFEIVARPWGIAGYVAIAATSKTEETNNATRTNQTIAAKLLQLRSALNVMEYHDHFCLDDVPPSKPKQQQEDKEDDKKEGKDKTKKKMKPPPQPCVDGEALYQYYKTRLESNPNLITSLLLHHHHHHHHKQKKNTITFRVTTDRTGDQKTHAFRSPDVEYEIGGALSEFYHPHAQPKMSDYDVNLRVDVVLNQVIIGNQINVADLSLRRAKDLSFRNAVTIKTNLAYVMLRLAGVVKDKNKEDDFLVVDPFCGAGTILLEALEMYSGSINGNGGGGIRVVGMDVSRRAVNGAAENARTLGYNKDVCSFHCCDARGIRKHIEANTADAIVSNLPWGVRTGQNQGVQDLQQMYEVFLRTSWYCLKPGGLVVMLVLRGLQMMRILRKLAGRYNILKVVVVRTTNNLPCIVVAEKLGKDELHENIKDQLNYMSSFINVSSEMYHAINMEEIDEKN